jgi:polar amino acid transport system permease protein
MMGIRYFSWHDVLYLVEAARWTVLLSLMAFLGGGLVGGVVTLLRVSRSWLLRLAAQAYIGVLQGTPLLMQLFVCFFLLVLIGVELSATLAAAIALTLNASAFLSEIWRGCIEAIPKTQWEAAASIGMTRMEQIRYIIAPQAIRIAVPPTTGMMVQIIKGTSLTALVGFVELTRAGQVVSGITYQPMAAFGTAALIYLALCFPLSAFSQRLERRFHVVSRTDIGL